MFIKDYGTLCGPLEIPGGPLEIPGGPR